jgi:hypothetical protein
MPAQLAHPPDITCANLRSNRIRKEMIMKSRTSLLAVTLFAFLGSSTAFAQSQLNGPYFLLPVNPTSADNLKLSLTDQTCGGIRRYLGNAYRVSMLQNNITVTLGERNAVPVPTCPPPPNGLEEIDLGRLPAGSYTLTLTEIQGYNPAGMFANFTFTVTDARATKAAPYVRLDYSGHWWDQNDSGWGLFIWQDAKSAVDSTLAAWFTYGADGKPIWHVFQPTWSTSTSTTEAALLRTSRAPGANFLPPGPTTNVSVGTASLDFTNTGTADVGKLTYTLTGSATVVRNIQRFKP